MALAIMNVGQYAKAPVRPSGDIVLTIQNQSTLGATIHQFATNGEIIIGISYDTNTIYVSADNGVNWQSIVLNYSVIDIYYSVSREKFYLLQSINYAYTSQVNYLRYAESDDGYSWSWSALHEFESASTKNSSIGHTIEENENGIFCYYIASTKRNTSTNSNDWKYVCENIDDGTFTYIGETNPYPHNTTHITSKTKEGFAINTSDTTSPSMTVYTKIDGWLGNSYVQNISAYKNRTGAITRATSYFQTGGSSLYVSFNYKTDVSYISPVHPSTASDYPIGYFELNSTYYVYSQTRIAKGDNIQGIMDIFGAESYHIADMSNICEIHHLGGQNILLSTDDGKIYKCTLT